jgi:membrane fusion protein (multidrug efflux system)
MPTFNKKVLGALLCLSALLLATVGWLWARADGDVSTDNAYVRADITSLAPKVSGYVRDIAITDNQSVKAGDILFRIDDRDYRARLAQSVANLEAAKARLQNIDAETGLQHSLIRQAEAQVTAISAEKKLAKAVSSRRRELILTSAVSQALLDESEAALSRSEAALMAASAALEAQRQRLAVLATQRNGAIASIAQADAARVLAAIDLDSTVVRAPVSGVVGNRQVRVGRLVAPGVPLLDIVPTHDLWVVANFKETQLEHIRAGQRADIRVDGYPGESFEGVVDSFAPGSGSSFSLLPADNATGNFVRVVQRVAVKIRFTEDPVSARPVPGLSARVTIKLERGT